MWVLQKSAENRKMAMGVEADMAEQVPEISFQKIKLKYSVFARFEIQ